ncbi:MAG: PPC domain-containing protein, partial [Nocardioides sp.]
EGWASAAGGLSRQRTASAEFGQARSRQRAVPGISVSEREPAGQRGINDTRAGAEVVTGFGTGTANPKATLRGTLSPQVVPGSELVKIASNREDDGAPELARDTGIDGVTRLGIRTTGFRGDAPGTGDTRANDFDLYSLSLSGGERINARMTRSSGNLEPLLFLVDPELTTIADTYFQDSATEAVLTGTASASGTYYVVALGYQIIDEPPLGPTTGNYSLTISAGQDDKDMWAVDLRGGDVLVATQNAPGYVSISGPTGTESHRAAFDFSGTYPIDSPLPGAAGYAASDYVVPRDGRYYVAFGGGKGAYAGELEVYRYGGKNNPAQTIFLDLDGARVNTRIWSAGFGVVDLSPFSKFLGRWGLTRAQEPALVDAIKANLTENLERDLAAAGLTDTVSFKVVSSLDGPDLTGKPGVTTIIVGGTIRESGIDTIGIAESIDPGNFARTETGLVLLDLLSEPGDRFGAPYSLNSYLGKGSRRIAFIAQGIGNVAGHEIGHLIGNYHTDNGNDTTSLMDTGGDFARFFGVGPDGKGGTADDRDVDFGADRFDPFEGSAGRE